MSIQTVIWNQKKICTIVFMTIILGFLPAQERLVVKSGLSADEHLNAFITDYLSFKEHGRSVKLSWTAAEYEEHLTILKSWQAHLQALPQAGLSQEGQVDQRLIQADLSNDMARIEWERRFKKDPGLYIPDITLIYTLGNSEEAERAQKLEDFLADIPALTKAGIQNLDRPVRFFLQRATERMASVLVIFRKEVLDAMRPYTNKPMLRVAYDRALEALEKYHTFLLGPLTKRANSPLGIGRELYTYYLQKSYLLNDDVDSILAKGERYFAETLALLESSARQLDPKKTWQQLIRDNRRSHPEATSLLNEWRKEISRARRHVLDRQLVTIPDGEQVLVVETPPSQRQNSPFGVMNTPLPFSLEKIGHLIINPIEADWDPVLQEKLLSGHDFTFIRTIAPHETYPGHHLHALKVQENPRPLRKYFNSTLFTEGWGLYCEELMYETGFFPDNGQTRLTQLLSRLWRAARVILDVKLQTDRIGYEEARRFLEEQVMFEPERSSGEVNMYLAEPTYFVTYIIGYFEIMILRDEYRQKMGENFSLSQFHEALLKTGAIPISLARKLLLEE